MSLINDNDKLDRKLILEKWDRELSDFEQLGRSRQGHAALGTWTASNRVIFGKLINDDLKKMVDLKKSEIFILWSLAIPTLLFGFYPEPLINTIEVSVTNLIDTYNLNIEIYLAKNN